MEAKELHERVLYPTVRIKTDKSGGSGVVIQSKPDPKDTSKYLTFVLTNWHVISDAIRLAKAFDSVIKAEVKKDILSEVTVESFLYVDDSSVVSRNAHQAEIVAYSQEHDLAVLKLLSPFVYSSTATLVARDDIKSLRLFDETWVCGCSLLHDPFANHGTITGLREIIDQKEYLMTNSAGIFGNSGGALFDRSGRVLGIVSRVTSIQLGFGIDIVPWMLFAAHPLRLYKFFEEQELHFLFDPADDYHKAMKRREDKRKRAQARRASDSDSESKDDGKSSYDDDSIPYGDG